MKSFLITFNTNAYGIFELQMDGKNRDSVLRNVDKYLFKETGKRLFPPLVNIEEVNILQ